MTTSNTKQAAVLLYKVPDNATGELAPIPPHRRAQVANGPYVIHRIVPRKNEMQANLGPRYCVGIGQHTEQLSWLPGLRSDWSVRTRLGNYDIRAVSFDHALVK
jgi:hypothetical protein